MARRHPSFLSTSSASLSRSSLPSRPTPVAIIQPARSFSYFDFPRSCPTEVSHFLILPSSSGQSQISFRAFSSLRCMHLRNMCVRDILNLPHHQHLSDISSSLFFLKRFRCTQPTPCSDLGNCPREPIRCTVWEGFLLQKGLLNTRL
jgi:hypothetical protein